jgi:hypothetical protein
MWRRLAVSSLMRLRVTTRGGGRRFIGASCGALDVTARRAYLSRCCLAIQKPGLHGVVQHDPLEDRTGSAEHTRSLNRRRWP